METTPIQVVPGTVAEVEIDKEDVVMPGDQTEVVQEPPEEPAQDIAPPEETATPMESQAIPSEDQTVPFEDQTEEPSALPEQSVPEATQYDEPTTPVEIPGPPSDEPISQLDEPPTDEPIAEPLYDEPTTPVETEPVPADDPTAEPLVVPAAPADEPTTPVEAEALPADEPTAEPLVPAAPFDEPTTPIETEAVPADEPATEPLVSPDEPTTPVETEAVPAEPAPLIDERLTPEQSTVPFDEPTVPDEIQAVPSEDEPAPITTDLLSEDQVPSYSEEPQEQSTEPVQSEEKEEGAAEVAVSRDDEEWVMVEESTATTELEEQREDYEQLASEQIQRQPSGGEDEGEGEDEGVGEGEDEGVGEGEDEGVGEGEDEGMGEGEREGEGEGVPQDTDENTLEAEEEQREITAEYDPVPETPAEQPYLPSPTDAEVDELGPPQDGQDMEEGQYQPQLGSSFIPISVQEPDDKSETSSTAAVAITPPLSLMVERGSPVAELTEASSESQDAEEEDPEMREREAQELGEEGGPPFDGQGTTNDIIEMPPSPPQEEDREGDEGDAEDVPPVEEGMEQTEDGEDEQQERDELDEDVGEVEQEERKEEAPSQVTDDDSTLATPVQLQPDQGVVDDLLDFDPQGAPAEPPKSDPFGMDPLELVTTPPHNQNDIFGQDPFGVAPMGPPPGEQNYNPFAPGGPALDPFSIPDQDISVPSGSFELDMGMMNPPAGEGGLRPPGAGDEGDDLRDSGVQSPDILHPELDGGGNSREPEFGEGIVGGAGVQAEFGFDSSTDPVPTERDLMESPID